MQLVNKQIDLIYANTETSGIPRFFDNNFLYKLQYQILAMALLNSFDLYTGGIYWSIRLYHEDKL